ncbi:hypothetical protein [Cupriavidus sp. D39]|uniref:hypothetical protein n=1 Tax=Cupriavidus sp. D39 TaxID=2997877 RepID=UPI003B633A5C
MHQRFLAAARPFRSAPSRLAPCGERLLAIAEALRARVLSTTLPPNHLLTAIMALATGWTVANPLGPSLDPEGASDLDTLRQNVSVAVRLLTGAHAPQRRCPQHATNEGQHRTSRR